MGSHHQALLAIGATSGGGAPITARRLATDGYNTTYAAGYEFVLSVGADVWWSGDFLPDYNKCARVTDLSASGAYPGPSNFTALPNAFDVYGWVTTPGLVWAYSSNLSKIDTTTYAVTSYAFAILNVFSDPLGNLWGQYTNESIRRIDQSNPTGTTLEARTYGQQVGRAIFTGGVSNWCFATVIGPGPYGLSELRRTGIGVSESTIALSGGTASPEILLHDTARGVVWAYSGVDNKWFEINIATGAVVRTLTSVIPSVLDTGAAVYDAARGMIWHVRTPLGGPSRLYGINTTTGAVDHDVSLSDIGMVVSAGGAGSTLVITQSGNLVGTGEIAPDGITTYDPEMSLYAVTLP